MANKIIIPQHEVLRTPNGWKDQERALIVQLERIHDDIYKHFRVANDLTTTEAGLVLDARQGKALSDSIDSINGKFATRTSYTPDITSPNNNNFAVDNKSFAYARSGGLLFISGRFEITNVGGSASSKTLYISIPSGYSCTDFVGNIGSLALNTTGIDISNLSIRQGSSCVWIQAGAGGVSNVLSKIGTGYVMINATVFIS